MKPAAGAPTPTEPARPRALAEAAVAGYDQGRGAERADVVAWLRAHCAGVAFARWSPAQHALADAADTIANGDHIGAGASTRGGTR